MSGFFIKEFFKFTRKERAGFLVLLILIVAIGTINVLIFKFIKPEPFDYSNFKREMEEIKYIREIQSEKQKYGSGKIPDNLSPEIFDPNSVSKAKLISMGFPSRVAENLIAYRNKGGRFHFKTDIKKIYGLSDDIYTKFESYIIIDTVKHINSPAEINEKSGKSDSAATKTLNINLLGSSELLSLNGIGPILSQRIIKYRDLLGGFVSKDQLSEVYGLREQTIRFLQARIIIDSTGIQKLNINTDNEEKLAGHPYLTSYHAQAIIKFRNYIGRYTDIAQIEKYNLVPEETFNKLKPYLSL